MKRLILAIVVSIAGSFFPLAQAQDRGAELDKAVEEARTAYLALKQAERRRTQGMEPLETDHTGLARGGSRMNEQYLARQAQLEQEVDLARRRYDAAQKRWNDLK